MILLKMPHQFIIVRVGVTWHFSLQGGLGLVDEKVLGVVSPVTFIHLVILQITLQLLLELLKCSRVRGPHQTFSAEGFHHFFQVADFYVLLLLRNVSPLQLSVSSLNQGIQSLLFLSCCLHGGVSQLHCIVGNGFILDEAIDIT